MTHRRSTLPTLPNLLGAALAVALLCSPGVASAETFTKDTLRPLLGADVNVLQANHYFIQSMLAFDSTPFTIGYSNQQARADFARIDGQLARGALNRSQFLLSLGFGRPATDFAMYGVLNLNAAFASDFPSKPWGGNNEGHVGASGIGVVLGLGMAYKGWVLQGAYTFHQLKVDADSLGRFTKCDDQGLCSQDGKIPDRLGAPHPVRYDTTHESRTSRMLTLENIDGYTGSVLFSSFEELGQDGIRRAKTKLASLRLLAQPKVLFEKAKSALGAGLTTYAPDVDYYGDNLKAVRAAVAEGRAAPSLTKTIVEFPFLAERIAGTGLLARAVFQASPIATPRLGEVGYVYEGNPDGDFLPQIGARAKVFRRDNSAAVSADAYAGFFWITSQSNRLHEGRGLSFYLSYSYNSPDASNFIPLADAHVIGFQLVWGNPAGLAPPITTIRVPKNAQRTDEVRLSDDEKKKKKALDELQVSP